MGAFEYTAVDPAGKQSKGVLEGDTARQVRQLLRDRQLLPLSVSEVAQKESNRQQTFTLRRSLSASDLALITRQLATLVKSSMPLEEALKAVGEQSENPRVQSIVLGVRAKVMEGHSLADGLADFPKAFPELFRATDRPRANGLILMTTFLASIACCTRAKAESRFVTWAAATGLSSTAFRWARMRMPCCRSVAR